MSLRPGAQTETAALGGFAVLVSATLMAAPHLSERGTFYVILGVALVVTALLAEGRLEWQRQQPSARNPTDWEFKGTRLALLLGFTTAGIQFVIGGVRDSLPVEVSLALDVRNLLGYGSTFAFLISRISKAREYQRRIERDHNTEVIYGVGGGPTTETQRKNTMHRDLM